MSQSTPTDSKHYQIRHLSGTSSELTFGPSNLSTVSTSISGPRANHEMRTISTYGTDIVFSESTNGTYVLYHHPDLHHDVRLNFQCCQFTMLKKFSKREVKAKNAFL